MLSSAFQAASEDMRIFKTDVKDQAVLVAPVCRALAVARVSLFCSRAT